MDDRCARLGRSLEVRTHHARLAAEPFHYPSYHALFEAHRRAGDVDAAFCIASTLAFLKRSNHHEEAYLQRHRRGHFELTTTRLDEDVLRKHVRHPGQSLVLSSVLGLMCPAIAAWRSTELPASCARDTPLDLELDRSPLASTIASVLDVLAPDVYLRPRESGGLHWLDVRRGDRLRPSLLVCGDQLADQTGPPLAFSVARCLMDLYPPHFTYVCVDRSPRSLAQILAACLHTEGLPTEGDLPALARISHEIHSRLRPAQQDALRVMLRRLVVHGDHVDVRRWTAATELTACRVGLLLCGDLRAAGRMLSLEPASLREGVPSIRDVVADLVHYSISEGYVEARRSIGMNVDADALASRPR